MSTHATRNEIAAVIAAELERTRSAQYGGFNEVALQWLALVPEWTDTLARDAGFPTGGASIEEFVRRAAAAQLCQVSRNLNAAQDAQIRFRMRELMRRELIAGWIDRQIDVRAHAADAAHAIKAAASGGTDVALGVRRWADLALAELEHGRTPGHVLTARIRELVEGGDVADTPTWLYAGEALEAPLGAEMSSAVRRAKARLRLYHRTERDRRMLEHFLIREEQVQALDQLLTKPNRDKQSWALHFIGIGGVGKTMLLRYLTGPYARTNGRGKLSAARIDFDHVDPRYPTERPGQLLEELADELSIYVQDRTREQYFHSLRTAIERANVIAKTTLPAGDALLPLRTREFANAIAAFASFVESLASPVVLILDTCEELAKLHPAGENVPSIDATFEILERIQEQAPSVRVVFAGRRPLTPHAHNWHMEDDAPQPPSVLSLRERDYLDVLEVHGFTRAEAHRYLTEVRGLTLDDDLFEAVLAASYKTAHAVAPPDDEPRFNPFDIARYAHWIERDGHLGAGDLATNDADPVDPYVRVRIVGRLADTPELLEALPFAAVLGRFDAALLVHVLGGDAERRRHTVLQLAEQEWIRLEGGSDVTDMVLAVEPGLLPRLRRYFEHSERARELDAASSRLRPVLRAAMQSAEPATLTAELVDAALRILPDAEATAAFEQLAQHVADSEAWAWAEDLCGRLLAIDRDESIPAGVQASARALYASSLLHRGATFNGASLWATAQEQTDLHPDRDAAELLRARAALGRVAALLHAGESVSPGGEAGPEALHAALAHLRPDDSTITPALLHLSEAVLDTAEGLGDGSMSAHVELILGSLQVADTSDRLLHAFSLAFQGRAAALAGRGELARPLFRKASQVVPRLSAPARQCYSDWVVPVSPRHRVLLEQLRHELAAAREPSRQLLQRCENESNVPRRSVDEERLLSLVVCTRLARRPLDDERLERICNLEEELDPHQPTAPAHRATPPLFVAVAQALLAAGRAGEALRLLYEREAAAVATRDEDTVRASAHEFLRTLRRLRLDERLGQARELAVADQVAIRSEALAATALIAGDEPRWTWHSGTTHWAWRAWAPTDRASAEQWRPLLDELVAAAPPNEQAQYALDRLELALLLAKWGTGESLTRTRRTAELAIDRLARLRKSRPDPRDPLRVELTRIGLRARALGLQQRLTIDENARTRACGELALEEGELLALRLPDFAVLLLDDAERLLANAEDFSGAAVASLRTAIACVHAGEVEQARACRADVERRFARASEILVASANTIDEPSAVWWRGWNARREVFLAWCEERTYSAPTASALEFRMEALPPFSRDWVTPPRTRRRVRPRAGERIAAILRMLIVVLVAGATAWAVAGAGLSLPVALAVGIACIGLLRFDAVRSTVALAAISSRFVTLDVDIAPGPDANDEEERACVRVTPHVPAWVERPVLYLWQTADFDKPVEVGVEGQPFDRLPRRLTSILGVRATRARRNVRLSVTPDVAVQPWEARLVGIRALESKRWTPGHAPMIWRRAQTPQRLQGDRWREDGIAVVASQEMQPFVRRALVRSGVETRPVGDGRHEAHPWGRAVLMVGTPVATGSGWRLRLSEEVGGSEISPFFTYEAAGETFVSPERGATIAPFVIVQVVPGGETPVLDRRTADALRGFANEAASESHAVLAIPSLPSDLAQTVLEHLANTVHRHWTRPPSTRMMTSLLTDLRAIVFSHGGRPPKHEIDARRVRAQVAYDVCLYVPDRETQKQ